MRVLSWKFKRKICKRIRMELCKRSRGNIIFKMS